jgi:O-antigen/teichoic acid export membrane protein
VSIARASALLLAAQAASLVLGFATSIVVARALGPQGRGVLALIGVLSDIVIWFATLGLGSAYAYLAGKGSVPRAALLGNCLLLALALGAVAAAGVLAGAGWLLAAPFRGVTAWQLVLAAAALPFAAVTFLLGNILIGAGLVRAQAALQVGSAAFMAAASAVALLGLGLGVDGMVVVLVASAVLVAAAHLGILWRAWGLSFRGALPIGRQAIAYGLKAYVGTITSYVWLRADVVLLNLFAGPAAVGHYSLAGNLAEKLWLLDASVGRAVLPRVIAAGRREAAVLAARASRNLLFVTGVAAAVLAAASPWLVPFLYGEAFRPAVAPLVLLLPGIVVQSAARCVAGYYSGQLGRPQVYSTISAVTMVAALLAYAALIPGLGAVGAAIGSTLAYALPMAVYLAIFPADSGLPARSLLVVGRDDLGAFLAAAGRVLGRIPALLRQHI